MAPNKKKSATETKRNGTSTEDELTSYFKCGRPVQNANADAQHDSKDGFEPRPIHKRRTLMDQVLLEDDNSFAIPERTSRQNEVTFTTLVT